jgi:PAS domain S-box-containing protein
VLNSLAEGVVVVNQAGNIVFTNPSFDRLFGYDTDELLGQHASVLNHDGPGAATTTVAAILSRLRSQGSWQEEVLNHKKDGTPFTTYVRVNVFEMDGEDYYVSAQEDITQRRRLEVQFHERERLALIGTFAVNMSHELGNRLNSLSSSVQMFERSSTTPQALSPNELAEIIHDLKAETARLEEVLWALRELSIPHQLTLQPVDVGEVITPVLQAQYARCTEHQIQQFQSFPDPLPLMMADQEKLAQVLTKLCDNAIDAMPNGGELTVEATVNTDLLSLSVHDTGAGIAENIDPFEPFLTTRAGGSGLGLAVAKQLVLSQSGTIAYSSNPQGGTTFTIHLPIAPQPQGEINETQAEQDA